MRVSFVLHILGSCALALGAHTPQARAQADSTWFDHARAGLAASQAGHLTAADTQLLVAYRLAGHLPILVYELGAVEARLGRRDDALRRLREYAAMGLAADVSRDSDFASLRGTAAFDSVLAMLATNRKPIARGSIAFTLSDPDILAEDIAYDSVAQRFYVTSVHRRKIITIDARTGRVSDFTPSGRDGVWGMLAIAVDAPRHTLWATTAAMPMASGYQPADSGRSALLEYDLRTAALRRRFELRTDPPAAHTLGDMTIGPDGAVYVSDGEAGGVYTVRPGGTTLDLLVPPGVLLSPQTPALAPGGRLLVADYACGVAIVDLATHQVSWIEQPAGVALTGSDGLYLAGRDLIAVQNGTTPNRVLRARLNAGLDVVEAAAPLESGAWLSDPTHGVVVGHDFYFIARSGWSRVRPDGSIAPGSAADAPVIRRVALPR